MYKRIKIILIALFALSQTLLAEDNTIYRLVPGHDYYIWNTYYNRPLAMNSDNTSPRLVKYVASNEEKYLFTAEKAPTSGYVLLKHKATGKYICASTSNTYSVVTKDAAGTGNEYQWRVKPGNKGYLVNRRSTDHALGVDLNETSDAIGVWYDKDPSIQRCVFQVYEAKGSFENSGKQWGLAEMRNLAEYIGSETQNSKYGVVLRNKLEKSRSSLEEHLANPDKYTADSIQNKNNIVRDSLALMTTNEASIYLVDNDMSDFSTTFALGITDLKFSTNYKNDSISVLIRNKEGLGARMAITEDGNYAFTMQDGTLKIYKDGLLTKETEAYFVPQYTEQGTEAEWSIIRKSRLAGAMPEILSKNKALTESSGPSTNKYGNAERTVISLTNTQLDIKEQLDLHLVSELTPLTKCTINLANEKAWIIFDNIKPSEVIKNYLSQIRINGSSARLNINCRVVIYLNGALVMPYNANESYFVGYDGEQFSGEQTGLSVGMHKDLGKNANRIRSFRLKRGYMATLASGTDGSGYSRVYVADHQDIEVPVLPNSLYGRISSVTVKKWQYVSKKGWCSTNDQNAINSQMEKIGATWYYTWSADRSSTYDAEYIPIRQHKWWPSINDIAKHEDATACLSINEPEHNEQHNNCDCGGAINEWTACTLTPDFQKTGMRIGAPSPTDPGWLNGYIGHCNDMAYRCDFVAIHAYWGDNEAANADAWYNKLKAIYDQTKRPIWITEWAFGASWTKESWPSNWNDKLEHNRTKIKDILQKLEQAPFVERYAYYQWDTQFRNLVDWSDGHVTPAGRVYRDLKSNFAYNADVQFVPVWWAPSLKTPSLKTNVKEALQSIEVTVTNENLDYTDILAIQKYNEEAKCWEDYYVEKDRSQLDNKTLTYTFPLNDFDLENDQLRVYVKRTLGDEAVSAGNTTGYITNPGIYATSKTSIEGWTCKRSAANGYTKATGDTYFEVWSEKAAGQQFDYYQDISDLPEGIYELSADVFNSTDNVSGAHVNGSVVLYAQADTTQYLANVTKDSEMEGAERLTIANIVVSNGTMRIGVRNIGEMSARWAGADNFKLIRKSGLPTNWQAQYYDTRNEQNEHARQLFFKTVDDETADASAYVINSVCQRNDNYAWNVSNIETASNESSDGQSGNNYWNIWKGSAYTTTMSQDVLFLPEGRYSANALLRGSADAKEISLTATVISPDLQEKSETFYLKGTGNVSVDGSPYKNGWIKAETDYVTVRPGDILRITMKGEFGKSGWLSADNFGLTWQYIEPILTGMVENATYGTASLESQTYDLSGRRISNRNGHGRENSDKSGRGIYIKNGKKIIR